MIDIIAEGAGHKDLREVIFRRAPLLQQDAQPRRNRPFGQLQVPHVPLIE